MRSNWVPGYLLPLGIGLLGCATDDGSLGHARFASDHPPRVEDVDAEHYALDLSIDPEARALSGTCTISLSAKVDGVDSIPLDLEELAVEFVREVGGGLLEFEQTRGKLLVDPGRVMTAGERITVEIAYGGIPRKGLWFIENGEGEIDQVFTQGQCIDARWWFPCFDYPDDRATSELRIRFPSDWVAVAAGERVETSLEDGVRVEHWKIDTPHPTYLLTFCAGEFELVEEERDGIPLSFLSDPEYADLIPTTFSETDEILAFLGELTGVPYPFSKYAQSCVRHFPHGGMENISATTLTEQVLTNGLGGDEDEWRALIVHEAAHQWFGDLLTCADWAHIWLNEGFATYATALYYEHLSGVDDFRVRMRDLQTIYTEADVGGNRRPTVCSFYRDPFDLFHAGHAYPGGASRLHFLRFVLGDEFFFEGLRRYVADHRESSVVTDDLREAMEAVSGEDLSEFFDQWFYSSGYPELKVRWSWNEGDGLVQLDVTQVQEPEAGTPLIFRVPVDVEVRDGEGRRVIRILLDQRKQRFVFPADREPTWVRFDKYGWLPARIASFKSAREWLVIAAEDDDVNGRRDATRALGRLFFEAADAEIARVCLDALISRLRRDPSPAVRRTAVEALGLLPRERSGVFLEQAARGDSSPAVRMAALLALANHGEDPKLALLAEETWGEENSHAVRIAAAALYTAASPATAFEWVFARVSTPSPHGVLSAGILRILARLPDDRVVPELLLRSKDERAPSLVRQAAVEGLALHGQAHPLVRDTLLSLLDTGDYRLRQKVIETLGRTKDRSVTRPLEKAHAGSVHSRERRNIEDALRLIIGKDY
jgi:aminopeptidase N